MIFKSIAIQTLRKALAVFFQNSSGLFGREGLSSDSKELLEVHFPYYRKLPTALKEGFEKRVAHFISNKHFEAIGEIGVPINQRILVAGYAAQLTLGMKDYKLVAWKGVRIYPTKFKLDGREPRRTWAITEDGLVCLSWSDFHRHLLDPERRYPLGLKAMAAILARENSVRQDEHFLGFVQAKEQASKEFMKNQSEQVRIRLFRDADLISDDRFLYSCLLNFFGEPDQLKNSYPFLYRDVDLFLHNREE